VADPGKATCETNLSGAQTTDAFADNDNKGLDLGMTTAWTVLICCYTIVQRDYIFNRY